MKLHAFVAMPFGIKHDEDEFTVDFTQIYHELIKPALENACLEVIRVDEERSAGDIREDMFQELLMADLFLVDLSIDNPNVWYELGGRPALKAGGGILIQGPRKIKPFDIYTISLIYGIEHVQFICLWNGINGNGPGDTVYMYNEVQKRTGNITWLNTQNLW